MIRKMEQMSKLAATVIVESLLKSVCIWTQKRIPDGNTGRMKKKTSGLPKIIWAAVDSGIRRAALRL